MDKSPGVGVLQVADRPQDAAGRLPAVTAWMLGCSFHARPVLWVAGTTPAAAAGQPVRLEDCRSFEM